MSEEVKHHRNRLGGATRRGNTEMAEQARRDMRVAKTAEYINELVESWPPPTPEQCERLSALLKTKPKTRK